MVWGGIAHGIKSQLIIVAGNMTAVRYRDEILRPVAVPLVQQRNMILQQDNARPHVALVCQDFLANNNIATVQSRFDSNRCGMSWTEGLGSAEIPPQLSHN